MKSQCLISFGSNLGSREQLVAEAARLISASHVVDDLQTSRLFETPPIGGPRGQEPFLNAVAAFETAATAREILELLQQVETRLGRRRRQRWDARSIDLDVVLHGELVGGGTGLTVPHPRYTARRFVLQPARDVAGHYRDPRFGWTLEQVAIHLDDAVPSMALVGGDQTTREEICRRLAEEHGVQSFAQCPGSLQTSPWVSANYAHRSPIAAASQGKPRLCPRLIARMQKTTAATRWPAPHQMWPAGWQWPEYRLEIDDLDWAVSEVASALASMQCPVRPITEDGRWF